MEQPRDVKSESANMGRAGGSTRATADRYEATAMLARSVAHDINNLMAVILGNADLAGSPQKTPAEIAAALRKVEDAADTAGHLAKRLLDFVDGASRPPEVININPIVYNALQYEEQQFGPKLRVKRFNDPDLWNVAADPNAVQQIVMMLCINALEGVAKEGLITLTTQNVDLDDDSARSLRGLRPGPHVLFSIEDSGGGLSDTAVTNIFKPPREGAGEPRSLALAYRLVKDHKGHIALRTEPGIGTTFDVYLPATNAALGTKVTIEGDVPKGHETILVVDDEESMRQVTRSVLESVGYHVVTATNGREAVDIAKTYDGTIHLALLDMAMPDMGGAEAYPLLKQARPDIRIVIMSGFDLGSLGKPLRDAGVSGLLQKPFRRNVLAKAVRDALDAGRN